MKDREPHDRSLLGMVDPLKLALETHGSSWLPARALPSRPWDFVRSHCGFVSTPSVGLSEWGMACQLKRLLAAQPLKVARGAVDVSGLSPGQVKAVHLAAAHTMAIITGGPGTGKTTCVKRVVDASIDNGHKVIQLAPTGMAARRLADSTGTPAQTVHSFIAQVQRGEVDPSLINLAVFDEVSMMGPEIGFKALQALPTGCRVIFMGDVDQLPSVDPGHVLRDMIESGIIPWTRLREIHRFESGGPIANACEDVLAGNVPRSATKGSVGFHLISKRANRIYECTAHAMKFLKVDIYACRTLCATRRDSWIANEQIKRNVNPRDKELDSQWSFTDGDPVRQVRNNWRLIPPIVNGDVGKFRKRGDVESVEFPHCTVPASKCDIRLAYASTIHSAQGCEYDFICIYITRRCGNILTRELMNTAISRCKRLCLLIAEPDHLKEVLARRTPRRLTRLREFLQGDDCYGADEQERNGCHAEVDSFDQEGGDGAL